MNTTFFNKLDDTATDLEKSAKSLNQEIRELEVQMNEIILKNPLYDRTPSKSCMYGESTL